MAHDTVTEEYLCSNWNPLSLTADSFDDCKKHPINYIPSENYDRNFYFFDCEEIVFQTENGKKIWSTEGQGEINVPQGVSILIRRGKVKGR